MKRCIYKNHNQSSSTTTTTVLLSSSVRSGHIITVSRRCSRSWRSNSSRGNSPGRCNRWDCGRGAWPTRPWLPRSWAACWGPGANTWSRCGTAQAYSGRVGRAGNPPAPDASPREPSCRGRASNLESEASSISAVMDFYLPRTPWRVHHTLENAILRDLPEASLTYRMH